MNFSVKIRGNKFSRRQGKIYHTCPVLLLGICLYEGDYLVGLQAMPIVPFVTIVKVYTSIFVKVVTSNNVHYSSLRFVVHGTAVANRQRKVVYWSSY
jgi:hypothetical protein